MSKLISQLSKSKHVMKNKKGNIVIVLDAVDALKLHCV